MSGGWRQGGEMTQALYAHMNNKTIKKKRVMSELLSFPTPEFFFFFGGTGL
jgi:hypothetical protein